MATTGDPSIPPLQLSPRYTEEVDTDKQQKVDSKHLKLEILPLNTSVRSSPHLVATHQVSARRRFNARRITYPPMQRVDLTTENKFSLLLNSAIDHEHFEELYDWITLNVKQVDMQERMEKMISEKMKNMTGH